MKAVILAAAFLAVAVTAAYAGDKNSPGTGCDKWAARCLNQRGAYVEEDQNKAAREAIKAKTTR